MLALMFAVDVDIQSIKCIFFRLFEEWVRATRQGGETAISSRIYWYRRWLASQANRIEGDSINGDDTRALTECMHNMKIDMLEFRFELVCCIQLHNKNNISIIHNFWDGLHVCCV